MPKPDTAQETPRTTHAWPRYRSHKVVHALKLEKVCPSPLLPGVTEFWPDRGGDAVCYGETSEVVKRCKAEETGDPGYLVLYADGFTSWSPTKAFDEGYAETGVTRFALPYVDTVADGALGLMLFEDKGHGDVVQIIMSKDELVTLLHDAQRALDDIGNVADETSRRR